MIIKVFKTCPVCFDRKLDFNDVKNETDVLLTCCKTCAVKIKEDYNRYTKGGLGDYIFTRFALFNPIIKNLTNRNIYGS